MKAAVDLHIHTALSPCASDDMTPNNIVNMSLLKGLDVIAITDHNCSDNVLAVQRVAEGKLIVIPGMELQTKEEIHLLCYFSEYRKLLDFNVFIDARRSGMLNVPQIFGNQLIIDEFDNIKGEQSQALIAPIDISLEEAVDEVRKRGGVPVPAHIDRLHYGIISQLGFIPTNLNFRAVEINTKNFKYEKPEGVRMIRSSDAHDLGDILESDNLIDVINLSVKEVLNFLRNDSF